MSDSIPSELDSTVDSNEPPPPPPPPPSTDLAATQKAIAQLKEMEAKRVWSGGEMNAMYILRQQVTADKASSNAKCAQAAEEALLTDRQKWVRGRKRELETAAAADAPEIPAPSFPKRKSLQDIEWVETEHPPFAMEEEEIEYMGLSLPFTVPGTSTPYKWCVSKKATTILNTLRKAVDARDQENFDMYINNDWNAYGLLEVMEGWIDSWVKEFKHVRPKAEELFFKLEAFLLWIACGYTEWCRADDGGRVENIAELINSIIAYTFEALDEQKLIHPESPLKNVAMVAALVQKWHIYSEDYCDDAYLRTVFATCTANGVRPSFGPLELGEDMELEKYFEENMDDEEEEDEEGWQDEKGCAPSKEILMDMIEEYTDDFSEGGKLGGKQYDLKRMSKAQREALGPTLDSDYGYPA